MSSGISFTTATALWGRYDPSIMDGIREHCINHGLVEMSLSVGEVEEFAPTDATERF